MKPTSPIRNLEFLNNVNKQEAMNTPAIELINVYKTLDGKKVLDGVSLSIERSETIAIMGGSGVGKSVTLKNIVGLMKPDKGIVKINGVDITQANTSILNDLRKKIGFLFQTAALLNSISVFENVALPLREHKKLDESEIKSRIREALALVGLSGNEDKMPSILSVGMRKRVGLARAIIGNPEIILYDEPTAGLDPVMGSVITDLIANMQKKLSVTSIVVTHDIACASKIANRIAMLHKGKIIKIGKWEEFVNLDDPIVQQFITGSAKGPLTEN